MLKLTKQMLWRPAGCRSFVSAIKSVEFQTEPAEIRRKKGNSESDQPSPPKIPKEMQTYFDEPSKRFVFDSFPSKLLQKNRKSPDELYLANEDTAFLIADIVKRDLKSNMTIIEANPGVGLITNHLVNETENDIFLYEPKEHFHKSLNVSPSKIL